MNDGSRARTDRCQLPQIPVAASDAVASRRRRQMPSWSSAVPGGRRSQALSLNPDAVVCRCPCRCIGNGHGHGAEGDAVAES